MRSIGWQDGTLDTCAEEAQQDAYDEILSQGQLYLDSRPKGISNLALAGIIGGGATAMILLIN